MWKTALLSVLAFASGQQVNAFLGPVCPCSRPSSRSIVSLTKPPVAIASSIANRYRRTGIIVCSDADYAEAGPELVVSSIEVPQMNHVVLIGRVGSDPNPKYFDNGQCVVSVSLAVNREPTPQQRQAQEQPDPDWFAIEAWGRQGERFAQRVPKGARLMIMGKLITSHWTDKHGQPRKETKIRLRHFEILQSSQSYSNPDLKYYSNWEDQSQADGQQEGNDEYVAYPDGTADSKPKYGYGQKYGGGSKRQYGGKGKSTYSGNQNVPF